jgi:hypothetical protein
LNKIVSTKRTSAIFLAIVLVAGITALSFPSFMTGAQAEPDYEMDDDKKSYGKDVSVKKIDCSNVNVNVNGFELNVLPPTIEDLTTSQAQALSVDEGKESNSKGSNLSDGDGDGQSDSDTNNRIVCISNNNNINVGEEPSEPLTCEECFTENLDEEQEERLLLAITRGGLEDLEGLCELLSDTSASNDEVIRGLLILFLIADITVEDDEDTILEILECLEDLRLLIVPEELPPLPEF